MSDIRKILIVDDDQSLINLLKDFLPKVINHKLFVALTGEEALKIIERERPDVILLDMQLPGIKGIQILKIIRDQYPATKVLVITSYDKQVKEKVSELKVDGFFPKPVILDEIIRRIEEVLNTKEDTTVAPVSLSDIIKKSNVIPKAKIMFIEREYLMPYLLPIKETDPSEKEGYGEYEFINVYCQKDAIPALYANRPDIVICATDVPEGESMGKNSVSTANIIAEIMKSMHPPKAIIVHGTQQDISAHGIKALESNASVWIEQEDMYNYDEDKDRENVERLNKIIWSVCFKHNLVRKTG